MSIASDGFLINLHGNIQEVSNICLPSNIPFDEKKTPFVCRKTEVLPFKDKALFWHLIWESAGKPINTELHMIMKRTRNIYHYQIQKCKKMKQTLKQNTLLAACMKDIKKL